MISSEIIQEMADLIAKRFHPLRIILFGSHAKGEATEESDVDFLVIARTSAPKPERSVPIYSFLRDYPYSKDIVVYTPEEAEEYRELPFSFIRRALREGKVLYEG